MVRSIDVRDDASVAVMVSLTTPGCPIRSHFQTAVAKAVTGLGGVSRVDVSFDVLTDTEKGALQRKLGRSGGLPEGALAQVSNVVCVGSGKGGVGKSTITANLAAALAAEGRKVVVAVYSEFGRRVRANASEGTDHGTASNVFLLGAGVRGGLRGEAPSLTDLDDGDLKYGIDFRDVYATLVADVLGADPAPVLGGGWRGRLGELG